MLITYILQVTLCLAFFYALYHLVLQKETLFQTNRLYLLSTMVISLILPLIRIYIQDLQAEPSIVTAPYVYVGTYLNSMNEVIVTPRPEAFPWMKLVSSIYLAGILFLSYRVIISVWSILKIKRKGIKNMISGQLCILSHEVKTPFSFFNTIYLPIDHQFSEDELKEIITHEKTHVADMHTLDILIMEMACIGLWPSPMVYVYRKKLREIHEFIADAEVLKNTPWESYASLLVAQKSEGLRHRLSNQLIYSQLKSRLIMMNKQRSFQNAKFKYFGIIPILLIAIVLFSFREKDLSVNNIKMSDNHVYNIYEDGLRISTPLDSIWSYQSIKSKHDSGILLNMEKGAKDTIPYIVKSIQSSDQLLKSESGEREVFQYVEEMPHFPGSNEAMFKYIYESIKYPEEEHAKGNEGMVVAKFIVEADGTISNAEVVRGESPGFNAEIIRVINGMNDLPEKWTPGKKDGKDVSVEFILPFKFVLQQKTPQEEKKNPVEEVYTSVDEMPRFPGCEELPEADKMGCSTSALFKYLAKEIRYPEEDRKNGKQGTVFVQFVVGIDGSVSAPVIEKGVSPGIDAEVIRIINHMNDMSQKWIPGRKDGKVVSVKFTLPVRFLLDAQKDISKNEDINLNETREKSGEHELPLINFSPNPANNVLNIEFSTWIQAASIFDESGHLVWNKKFQKDDFGFKNIDVSKWIPGKYTVQAVTGLQTYTASFVVQH